MAYDAGAVKAKIELDTKEFKNSITDLKEQLKTLKQDFKDISLQSVAKEVDNLKKTTEQLKKQQDSLSSSFKDSQKNLESFTKGQNHLTDATKKNIEVIKQETKELTNATKANEKYLNTSLKAKRNTYKKLTAKDFSAPTIKVNPELVSQVSLEGMKNAYLQYDRVAKETAEHEKQYWQTRQSSMRNAMEAMVGGIRNIANANVKLFASEGGYNNYINTLSKLKGEFEKVNNVKFTKLSENIYKNGQLLRSMGENWQTTFSKITNSTTLFKTEFKLVKGELEAFTRTIGTVSGVLKTFDYQLLQSADKTRAYTRALELASKMHRMFTQGTENYNGGKQFGYSNYIKQINEVDKALGTQKSTYDQIHGSQSKFAQGNEKSVSSLRRLTGQLNSSNNNLNTLRRGMQYVDKDSLRAKWGVDSFGKGVRVAGEYTRITGADLDAMGKNLKNTDKGVRNTSKGMLQGAHSSRILSNTLYQLRGALLSLKMIFTAMGGMALWGFATEIATGIKETFTAKNEIEAQLRQNKKVDASGIQYFNQQLTDLTKTYRKINKYSIGETVSAIGLEFDLNAKQMAESLDVVSMIQSEYVRAGRKESEAALAVKDILQGEFQRLSRETGVGKEELEAYGWNGDKTDVESLMNALRKAALDRHWDIFAKKATSLNDVMTILKSRLNETGADLLQSVTPMVVEGFNMLIGAIEGVQNAFNGLNPFWKNLTLFGGGTALFGGLLTVLPMVTRGMGLAQISTIGWGKSLATAALNLNKAEVAQYGFRKALVATITGTKATDLANIRSTKAIMGRILGVKQSVLAEHNYGTALVHSKALLKNHTGATNVAKIASMGLAQKLAYLTNNMKLQDAQALGTGRAILKTATSFKVLKMAIVGVTSIALVAWFASIAAQADRTKKNIEAFNEIAASGSDKLESARKQAEKYQEIMDKYEEGSTNYKQAKANKEIIEGNIKELETANQLVGSYKLQNKAREENIKLATQIFRKNNLIKAGYNPAEATEKAAGWTDKIKAAQSAITTSYQKQYDWLNSSSKHISENVGNLQKAGANQEQLNKYIYEYGAVAEEAGEHLKQFYQGDISALGYYVWDRIRLAWIDIANHPVVVELMGHLSDTWKSWQPTLKAIAKYLSDVGLKLVELANSFLSSDFGKQAALWGTLAGAIGLVSIKFNALDKVKTTISTFKTLGSKLKDLTGKWKKTGDAAEEAIEKMGGKGKSSTSTGGINGGTTTGTSWLESTGEQLKNDATKYVRAAMGIAAGMALITEAIIFMKAPMLALSKVGELFERDEASIRKGIDGLKLIAPTVITILVPVMGLVKVMDMWGSSIVNFETIGYSIAGIAAGMFLVAEAVATLAMPMVAIAGLGWVKDWVGDGIEKGKQAIDETGKAVMALAPTLPLFAAAMALGYASVNSGGAAFITSAIAIAAGMLLVTEAIESLALPMRAIAQLGTLDWIGADSVKTGAEKIKDTAIALTYVEQAMRSLTMIHWEMLADYIASIAGKQLHIDMNDLSGIMEQLRLFSESFEKINITPINPQKATDLQTVATSITTISEALKTVKTALENLPDFKSEFSGTALEGTAYAEMNESTSATDSSSFFEQVKQPIIDLSKFIDEFNNLPITAPAPGKVEAINQSASMIGQVKTAIDNLKASLGGAVDAGWNANMAQGGIGAAVRGVVFGLGTGSSSYSSSLGSSLDAMYNAIKDIMTFTTNVNNLTGGDSGNSGGSSAVTSAVNMVTAVDNAIQNLQTTLSSAAPSVKESAKAIGTGIVTGIKEGLSNLNTDVISKVTESLNAAKPHAHTYGQGVGDQAKQGYTKGLKLKSATEEEIRLTLEYLDGKKQEFYDKGAALGDSLSKGYQDKKGLDHHSPGRLARATFAEVGYIEQAFDEAISIIPSKAAQLGDTLSTSYSPQIATDIGLTDMSAFESGLNTLSTTATTTDMQTSNAFNNMNMTANTSMNGMTTSVNGAFSNIQQNTTSRYAQLVSTTRVSLNSMQSQTTKNINAIKTSWRGMQTALIQSAENIRNETGAKIKSLESNMASFWAKVQNPSTLMAAAGPLNSQGTIRRRSTPSSIRRSSGTSRRSYAAGPFRTGKKQTGITASFGANKSSYGLKVRNVLAEYLKCLSDGGNCAMGSGWSFSWTKDIQNALLSWHTHFGEIYDDKLTVGKFENDDFPVRGDTDIFKKYVYDAISRTSYAGYFDSAFGDDPIAAYNSGHFNCWDGANIVMRLASAFGLSSHRVWGSWNGIPHVWAYVDGVGDVDATAIQNGYGFTSPKVTGAGPLRVRNASGDLSGLGDTHNYGDVNVTINVYGDDVEVNENKVDKSTAKQIIDLLGVNPATGQ